MDKSFVRQPTIPIWEKANLTLNEASEYFNIGVKKLREITDSRGCQGVLWVGNKRLIKRKEFEKYLSSRCTI